MDKRLEGKVALITGAASGIGLACARRFAGEGAQVAGFDLNHTESWPEVSELASKAGFIQGDVTDENRLKEAVESVVGDFGRIDILVTAAGIAKAGPVHLVEESDWDDVININLKGTFLAAKAALPTMMAQRAGSIITIASIEGIVGTEAGSSYNASKGGVVVLTKNIALDYARLGIRCNAICPGFIDTPLLQSTVGHEAMADFKKDIQRETKLGRFGKAEEMAGVAFFLASEDSSFVTGQTIVADGGYLAGHAHGMVEKLGLV